MPAPRIAIASGPCGPPIVNPVACENTLPGNPQSEWDAGIGDPTIVGFTTDISANKGDTVRFKISTPASAYTIAIYRLGFYGGMGGRKVAVITPSATLPQNQPACQTDAASGLIDCGNWGVSASWTVPTTSVSGIYVALLTRSDTLGQNNIVFVVRDDSSTSDMLYQTSDTTWEAYNQYGGNSLYTGTAPAGRAYKVSYNRPFTTRGCCVTDFVFYAEYPMVRYLEANGYDVSYFSGVDADRHGVLIKQHKVYLSVGHDEYWSGQQRTNVEAARDAGVSLAFLSGNEVFWKTRWENSIDGSGTPYRTLVTYKETHANAVIDPQDPPIWTGTWRDPRFSPPADGGRPENALTGTFFTVNSGTAAIQVPSQYAGLRFWRNTSVASLAPGQTATLAPSTLGYEWDEDLDNGFRPPGLLDMSATTMTVPERFQDYGTTVAQDTATHHLTLYRAPSGALVFGAGTVQWTWGLDSQHDSSVAPADIRMQQATVNLFADMGAQPATLQPGLVAASPSTDTVAPTSTITSPAAGASYASGATVTISGTAADGGGGMVAGVEVSGDGGTTWHPARGTSTWSYTWTASGSGPVSIKSRAVDDSGNLEKASSGTSVMVNCPCSIWSTSAMPLVPADPDTTPSELGVKFRSDVFMQVTGIRFYKGTTNTGTHVGHLWGSDGTLLATATFSGETASGWQAVTFASPVTIAPNTTYIASYFAPSGHYADTVRYFYPPPSPPPNFGSVVDSPPLHAMRNAVGAPNGVFNRGTGFPVLDDGLATNYWVDVIASPINVTVPGAPTNVVATPGNSSAGITWTAPPNGGFTISKYTVTPYIGTTAQPSTDVVGSPPAPGTNFPQLSNGTTYTFTVTATNAVGTGAASAASNSVTPTVAAPTVQDGGFESGLLPWDAGGAKSPVTSTAKAHSGTASVFLGATGSPEPNGDSWISQTVTVPSGTSTLTFWYLPATIDDSILYDWQEGQVRNPAGATLASVFKVLSNSQAWTQVTFNMSPYANQTVVLWFNVHEDGASPADSSSIYLDDVAITGSGQPTAPGQPTAVGATAGNGSATVSWTAPPNGGSPITKYTVTPFVGTTPQPSTDVLGSPPATSVTITGLSNGTAYTFTVSATNAVGTGPASAPSNAVTPSGPTAPGAPTSVLASAGDTTATVGWTAPSNGGSPITRYTVTPFVGATPQPSTDVLGSPPATSVTITGLSNGTTYTFTVSATNAVGTGPASAPSNAVTPSGPTAPGAPTSVLASAGDTTATVSWTAPSNGGSPITKYTVTPHVGATPQPSTDVLGSPPATSVTITGLSNGTTYTFTVTATNAVGTGQPSAASNAVTPAAPTAPAMPTGVSAVAGNASATVSWTAPSNGGSPITKYTVTPFIGPTAQPPTDVLGPSPPTSVTIGALTAGTTYTFTVTASNAVGTGPPSAQSNPVTPTAYAVISIDQTVTSDAHGTATTALFSTASPGELLVAFAAADGPSSAQTLTVSGAGLAWTLNRRVNAQGGTAEIWSALATNQLSGVTVTSTEGSSGYDQSLTVLALKGASGIGAVNGASAATGAPTVSVTTSRVGSWVVGAGNDWDRAVGRTLGANQVFEHQWVDTTAGDTFWVQAVGSQTAGSGTAVLLNDTAPTNDRWNFAAVEVLAVSQPVAPGAPTAVTAAAANASATVSWTAPGNGGSPISKYTVTPFIGASAQPSTDVLGSPPATSTTITGLTNGTAYTFTVTATNAVGSGPPSAASNSVTPAANSVPAAPTGVSATAGNASATVSWTAPSNGGSPITKYTVTPFIGTNPQTSTDVVGSPPPTSVLISGLTIGTSYTFTVTATNGVGTGPPSAQSNPVTPTTYAAITIDQTANRDAKGNVTTPAFSTSGPGELLVALVTSDGPAGAQTLTVSGAGLTWTLNRRTNTQRGTAEIWSALASTQLTAVTVTSTEGSGGYDQSLTVLALKGASGIGAVNGNNAGTGGPTVSVTTTRVGSWIVGDGNDWDRAVGRTLGPNQVFEHQWVDSAAGDTFWAQAMGGQTAASGTVVQLNDTAPTNDRWNFTAVEVLAS